MAPPVAQSNWIYGIGDTPMSNYTDDGVNPASLIKFVTSDQQAAKISVGTQNNEGHSTGTDWGTEQWTTSHDVEISFNIDPTILMLRRLLYAFFGQVATSSPALGVTKDIFTPLDANTSRQLPSYWITERCASAHDALYPSCNLEKLSLKGEELGKLNASGTFRGSGKQLLAQNITINPETNKYYLKNTMSKIVRATAAVPGTPVKTYQCGLQSFNFDGDNGHDPKTGYDPGCQRFYTAGDPDSGVIRSYYLFGRRKYGGKFIIWAEDSAPEIALLRAQAELDLKMSMTGKTIASTYKNLLELEMHLAVYSAVDLGSKDGFTTMEITPNALYSESLNKIVSATVQYPTPA